MIVSKIFMGQGNQMFQYAAGKALSLHLNQPFKVDTSSYKGYSYRRYELSEYFCLNVEEVTEKELSRFQYLNPVKKIWNKIFPKEYKIKQSGLSYETGFFSRKLLQLYDLISSPHKRIQYEEPHYHFNPDFFKANSDIYLKGYWMSYKYFEKYNDIIKKDFTVKPALVAHLTGVANNMKNENSVSILFRRGDLINNEKYTRIKGIIPLSFYHEAINILEKKFGDLVLYIFSDEINWVLQNLKTRHKVIPISGHISKGGLDDFYLMSKCKHNIIANSTFGWWAGWLNDYKDKIILAPSGWYSKYIHYNSKDVYPPDWLILDHPYWDGK